MKGRRVEGMFGDKVIEHTPYITEEDERVLPDPETLTCFKCDQRDICKLVDDPYNTDGDCLAMK